MTFEPIVIVTTLFGMMTSTLLGILVLFARHLVQQLDKLGGTVNSHAQELATIKETVRGLDRRQRADEAARNGGVS